MTTNVQDQRNTRRTIAGITAAAALSFGMLVGSAGVDLSTAPSAEAATAVRWAHPVHGKRPMSLICRYLNICKTETIKWRGNPNIAYTNPKTIANLKVYSITYRY